MTKFFEPLRKLLAAISSLNVDEIALDITKQRSFQQLVIRLNTEGEATSQLYELNEDSKGRKLSDIGGDYSPFTIEAAKTKGQPKKGVSDIDLKDTGAFYLSFRVEPYLGGFVITADPVKDEDNLFTDWGIDIVGLNEQNLQIVIDFYRNAIQQKVNERIKAY